MSPGAIARGACHRGRPFTRNLVVWRLALFGLTLLACTATHPAQADDWATCAAAAADTEAMLQLPSGLLAAIGRVESGRHETGSGRTVPWPWTINAAGRGQSFDDAATALAATRALLAEGVASIDIGCFQVNLAFHPDAFDTLEAAFDPGANARAAGRFLAGLRDRTGSWEGAIAAYHSATPDRGTSYRVRVLAEWGQGQPVERPTVPPIYEISWSPPGAGMQVWKPSSPGAAPSVIRIRADPELPPVRTVSVSARQ